MVLPIGPDEGQVLAVIEKVGTGKVKSRALIPVRFSRLETVL